MRDCEKVGGFHLLKGKREKRIKMYCRLYFIITRNMFVIRSCVPDCVLLIDLALKINKLHKKIQLWQKKKHNHTVVIHSICSLRYVDI